ncbi:MAG: hypothetical protein V5783_08290 [Pontiella sp.]
MKYVFFYGKKAAFTQQGSLLKIKLPAKPLNRYDTAVKGSL